MTSTLTRVEDGTTHHDHVPIGPALWGDLPTPYEAHDFYGNPVDSPGRYLLPGYNRIVGSGTYQMWMMFEPTYGVGPLRIVEWSWSGSATNSPAGWGLESGQIASTQIRDGSYRSGGAMSEFASGDRHYETALQICCDIIARMLCRAFQRTQKVTNGTGN